MMIQRGATFPDFNTRPGHQPLRRFHGGIMTVITDILTDGFIP